jgi:competence protein ComEC
VEYRGRTRGEAQTWPQPRAWDWRGAPWPSLGDLLPALAAHLKESVAIDFGPGRLMPWFPVAFALGIALYFAAEHEPLWLAAAGAAGVGVVIVYLARRHPVAFPACVVACAAVAGFAAATLRTSFIAHPVLDRPVFGASVTGFVEAREQRERTDRIIIAVYSFEGGHSSELPERVRLSVKRGTAPPVGSFVSLKARLNPPLTPLRPGGYDFARDLYFQRIGAIGFAAGAIKVEAAPTVPSLRVRYAGFIDHLRDGIDKRIRAGIPGDAGAIASALITGKRDAISEPVNDAMFVSSLGHILSISGYHMAVVAGVVFFLIRALLALIPGLSSRYPIKKWGASVALVAAACYLALSGAEVATQRAFIMTAIVLLGVIVDRAALTLRTLAIAAMAVLILSPESVVHPSFQMSFAATLALVAAYERGIPFVAAGSDTSLGARIALWGGREITMLVFASLVAGLATTPYAAFHFHRAAPYGVIANLLAMPIVSAWVMPVGLTALVALPFGLDGPLWQLMGLGVNWMTAVAQWVAGLPGAVGRVPAFGTGALLVATVGLICVCLLRTRMRWVGIPLILLACVTALTTPRADVLISAEAEAVAVRTAGGKLSAMRFGSSGFAIRDWLAADADARSATDPTLKDGFSCDDAGCIARLPGGDIVAIARTPDALVDDCMRAALIVASREPPPGCTATAITRRQLRGSGALALRRDDKSWQVEATRARGMDRPWGRGAGEAIDLTPAAPNRPAPRDATPHPEDIEADD